MWYSSWPSMGSLTTLLIEFRKTFSVRSLVPIQSWKLCFVVNFRKGSWQFQQLEKLSVQFQSIIGLDSILKKWTNWNTFKKSRDHFQLTMLKSQRSVNLHRIFLGRIRSRRRKLKRCPDFSPQLQLSRLPFPRPEHNLQLSLLHSQPNLFLFFLLKQSFFGLNSWWGLFMDAPEIRAVGSARITIIFETAWSPDPPPAWRWAWLFRRACWSSRWAAWVAAAAWGPWSPPWRHPASPCPGPLKWEHQKRLKSILHSAAVTQSDAVTQRHNPLESWQEQSFLLPYSSTLS